jgi:hypothetical protein
MPTVQSSVLSRTLLACFVRCDLPLECLLNTQTTEAGLATSKTPQPQVNLVDIAAPPSASGYRVGTLRLLNMCGIVGVEFPARKRGTRGTLPAMLAAGAT